MNDGEINNLSIMQRRNVYHVILRIRTHSLLARSLWLAMVAAAAAVAGSSLTRVTAVPMPLTTMPDSPSRSNFC